MGQSAPTPTPNQPAQDPTPMPVDPDETTTPIGDPPPILQEDETND